MAPPADAMLYHVPSGSKSPSSGFLTGFSAWKPLRSEHRVVGAAAVRVRLAVDDPLRTRRRLDIGAAKATLGNVQVSVRAEREPTRVVEAGREHRDRRRVMLARCCPCASHEREDAPESDQDGKKRHRNQKPSHSPAPFHRKWMWTIPCRSSRGYRTGFRHAPALATPWTRPAAGAPLVQCATSPTSAAPDPRCSPAGALAVRRVIRTGTRMSQGCLSAGEGLEWLGLYGHV
jgi:hypothetical protein